MADTERAAAPPWGSVEPPGPTSFAVPVGPVPPNRSAGTLPLRLIGILLVVGLVSCGAVAVASQFATQRRVDTSTVTAPVSRVVLTVGAGDVRVHPGSPGQGVRVTRTLTWSWRDPQVTISTGSGVLTVDGRCTEVFLSACSVDLDVTVPPGTGVDMTTTTGDVRASTVGGDVRATTSTGDVALTAPGASAVIARTSTGDLSVTEAAAAASVEASTSTGNIDVSLSAAPSVVRADSGTGDIDVLVPPGDGYRVEVRPGTGDATIGVPRDDGAARSLVLHSGTGNVDVRTH
jgi:Putative adhesin